MRYSISAILVMASMITPALAAQDGSSTFHDLHELLASGKRTTVFVEPSQCQTLGQADGKGIPAGLVTGFLVQGFIEKSGQEIRFADNHLTVAPDGAARMEIVQYRVTNDERGFVKVTTVSPTTYTAVAPAREIECKLGSGMRFLS